MAYCEPLPLLKVGKVVVPSEIWHNCGNGKVCFKWKVNKNTTQPGNLLFPSQSWDYLPATHAPSLVNTPYNPSTGDENMERRI